MPNPAQQPQPAPPHPSDVNLTVEAASNNALTSTRRNLRYLLDPHDASANPSRLRTRALLRALHSLGAFLFWRLVRYAKYAAVGALSAAALASVSALGLGGVVTGAVFLAAPPTWLASLGLGALWAVGRWGYRRAANWTRARRRGVAGTEAEDVREPAFLADTFA